MLKMFLKNLKYPIASRWHKKLVCALTQNSSPLHTSITSLLLHPPHKYIFMGGSWVCPSILHAKYLPNLSYKQVLLKLGRVQYNVAGNSPHIESERTTQKQGSEDQYGPPQRIKAFAIWPFTVEWSPGSSSSAPGQYVVLQDAAGGYGNWERCRAAAIRSEEGERWLDGDVTFE